MCAIIDIDLTLPLFAILGMLCSNNAKRIVWIIFLSIQMYSLRMSPYQEGEKRGKKE